MSLPNIDNNGFSEVQIGSQMALNRLVGVSGTLGELIEKKDSLRLLANDISDGKVDRGLAEDVRKTYGDPKSRSGGPLGPSRVSLSDEILDVFGINPGNFNQDPEAAINEAFRKFHGDEISQTETQLRLKAAAAGTPKGNLAAAIAKSMLDSPMSVSPRVN